MTRSRCINVRRYGAGVISFAARGGFEVQMLYIGRAATTGSGGDHVVAFRLQIDEILMISGRAARRAVRGARTSMADSPTGYRRKLYQRPTRSGGRTAKDTSQSHKSGEEMSLLIR